MTMTAVRWRSARRPTWPIPNLWPSPRAVGLVLNPPWRPFHAALSMEEMKSRVDSF